MSQFFPMMLPAQWVGSPTDFLETTWAEMAGGEKSLYIFWIPQKGFEAQMGFRLFCARLAQFIILPFI